MERIASTPQTYIQVRRSYSDGRSWDTCYTGIGIEAVAEARQMVRELTASPSTDFLEVILEERAGAATENTRVLRWSRSAGWR